MNKKGLSALVGVVLIVLLVVAISLTLFRWINKEVGETSERGDVLSEKLIECRDFDVEFEEAYCKGEPSKAKDNRIFVKVTNNENYDLIEYFEPRLIGEDGADASIGSVNNVKLKAYEGDEIIVFKIEDEGSDPSFGPPDYKPVEKIELVPKFFIGDDTVFCQDNKVVLNAQNC